MAAASMHAHKALTQPTVIGDCVGWRSAQRELVQTSLASAAQTRARRSRFVCQLASPTHDLAASGNSSEGGAQPNQVVGVSIDISDIDLTPSLPRRVTIPAKART